MIKQQAFPNIIERYDQYVSFQNGEKYELKWKSHVLQFYTCGSNNVTIECLDLIPESVTIRSLNSKDDGQGSFTLQQFNQYNKAEQLDLHCNCHGFTFANGKYAITDRCVNDILEDEFVEVEHRDKIKIGDFNVVCIKNEFDEYIHSCKYQYELFIQKEGIRKFTIHSTIEEVTQIEEYKDGTVHYYKRKELYCPGICLNAIGEPYVKTFANND